MRLRQLPLLLRLASAFLGDLTFLVGLVEGRLQPQVIAAAQRQQTQQRPGR